MSTTNGSFSPVGAPDLSKAAESYVVAVAAGAGAAQVINPVQPQQSFTFFNTTNNWMRGIITYVAGVAGTGTGAFLVPPGGTYTWDTADHDGDNALGSINSIESISVAPVAIGAATAAAETLSLSAAAVAGVAAINFASA